MYKAHEKSPNCRPHISSNSSLNPFTNGDLQTLFAHTRSQYVNVVGSVINMQNLTALCNGNATHVKSGVNVLEIPTMIQAELCNTHEDSASR